MEMSQHLQLPLLQYTKLLKYKDTLGCSSDAELIGLLTQTFLYTLAQPLSISSKEVDLLLSQGQGEPKIRNIMMALLIQCLSKQGDVPLQKTEKCILRSHSPLLDPSTQLSPLKNLRLQGSTSTPSPLSRSQRPSPLLNYTTPLYSGSRKSSFTSYSSDSMSSTLPTAHKTMKVESPSLSTGKLVPQPPLLTHHTPWLLNSTPLGSDPPVSLPPLHIPTPVISLSNILSTPPIQSPDGKSILIPVDSSMFQTSLPLAPHYSTPVASPSSTPKKEQLGRKLYQGDMVSNSPLVTVLNDSLLLKQSPQPHPEQQTTKSSTPLNVETDIEAPEEHAVQGPTTNVCLADMTSESSGMSSPVSSLERNSPISSLPDTNGVDLNEVLKALSSEDGCSDSQDEVVNKLVTIINELVETTEISMEDIIEMMKSSVECQGEEVMATSQTDILQPATNTTLSESVGKMEYVPFMTSSKAETVMSSSPGSVPVFGEQGLPGLLLPTNWMQLNLQALTGNNLKVSPTLRAPNSFHPYHKHSRGSTIPSSTSSDHHGNLVPQRPADKKSNVCSTCNTSFSQFSSLLRHIRQVHQKIKDKPCTICGERFARSQYLPNHIWRTHYNRATTNVKCFFCPEVLCSKEGIQQHLWLNHVKARR